MKVEDKVFIEGIYDTLLRFTGKVMEMQSMQEDQRLRLQKIESNMMRFSKGPVTEQGHNDTPWRGKKNNEL